jgi:hypothetical protein
VRVIRKEPRSGVFPSKTMGDSRPCQKSIRSFQLRERNGESDQPDWTYVLLPFLLDELKTAGTLKSDIPHPARPLRAFDTLRLDSCSPLVAVVA